MKLLSISALLLLQLGGHAEAFSLSMSSASPPAGRSALSQQYKSIMSVHHGISAGYPRMAPPGEPEPEVRCVALRRRFNFIFHVARIPLSVRRI